MKIGILAARAGVSTDTLRYYEKRRLISAERRANGYRDFTEPTVERVRLIRLAQTLGFTLCEIREILTRLGDDLRNEDIAVLLTEKLAEIQARILALHELQELLVLKRDQARSLAGF